MRNWFDIAVPHEDIRNGDFDEAVFAADLGDVVRGRAAADYNDPYLLYKKTYLTHGLESLLRQVHARLSSGKGSGVVELQTPFGGGKTHALVTVYHYLRNGYKVKDLLPSGLELISPSLSAIVGTQLNPAEGTTSDGLTRRTLWGEMAYQIGGEKAYSAVQQNDERMISPGKDTLRTLLESHQPFVLLFDEILEYVVRARGVRIGTESTLASQTLAFFQELTEAVAASQQGLMIVTLPSSELEDFGDTEQHNLNQLEKIFGRLESIETPVQGEEVYSIIRRRLFEPIRDDTAVREIVESYIQKYQEHKEELPGKAREADYRRKLEMAFPFHPDVIDILYEKWGTFSSFQRTRGVLRLLANVVEEVYQSEKNIDLILPGDINLGRPSIRQEFLRHVGQEYESIIGSDIAGAEAKAQMLDRANRSWKHLAERITTAVFVHSFTADESEKGVTLPYIKLAVLRPDTIPSLVTEVLQKLANEELWYLNPRGERYFISDVPNLNRMVIDKKELVTSAVRPEIERRVKKELGSKLRCLLWPQGSDEIPNSRELKLVVLDPENPPSLVELQGWLERCGPSFRVYKNTLFFALPDAERYARFEDSVREYLALREIMQEIEQDTRPRMAEKRAEVDRRVRDLEEHFSQQVRELYRTVAVPTAGGQLEPVDLGRPTIGRDTLDSWYWNELTDEARGRILARPPSSRMLIAKFLGNRDLISLSDVLEQFHKDPGLPVPASNTVLAEAIVQGVAIGTLGIGSGTETEINPQTVKFNEQISPSSVAFSEDSFLLTPERAAAEKAKLEGRDEEQEAPKTGTKDNGVRQSTEIGGGERHEETVKGYSFRASGIPVGRIADLNRGVLIPLSKEAGEFTFTIEIDVTSTSGISKRIIENHVKETLRQLGAEIEEKGGDDGR